MLFKHEYVQFVSSLGPIRNCECYCTEDFAKLERFGSLLIVLDYISTPAAISGFQAGKTYVFVFSNVDETFLLFYIVVAGVRRRGFAILESPICGAFVKYRVV